MDTKKIAETPIEQGEGLISYRKHLWALHYLGKKKDALEKYKQSVVVSIDQAIAEKEDQEQSIKGAIESAMMSDPAVDKTKTGGKTLKLPDIAIVSISKEEEKIEIENQSIVREALGEDFTIIKLKLDVVKAKKHLKEKVTETKDGKVVNKDTGEIINGVNIKKERKFSIRFKR